MYTLIIFTYNHSYFSEINDMFRNSKHKYDGYESKNSENNLKEYQLYYSPNKYTITEMLQQLCDKYTSIKLTYLNSILNVYI